MYTTSAHDLEDGHQFDQGLKHSNIMDTIHYRELLLLTIKNSKPPGWLAHGQVIEL